MAVVTVEMAVLLGVKGIVLPCFIMILEVAIFSDMKLIGHIEGYSNTITKNGGN